jgi:phosphate/sulfate permease
MAFESPPLWVWAIIVGVLIAGKFIYRWRVTKEIAKEAKERRKSRQAT